jgi:hypothetical protein
VQCPPRNSKHLVAHVIFSLKPDDTRSEPYATYVEIGSLLGGLPLGFAHIAPEWSDVASSERAPVEEKSEGAMAPRSRTPEILLA